MDVNNEFVGGVPIEEGSSSGKGDKSTKREGRADQRKGRAKQKKGDLIDLYS